MQGLRISGSDNADRRCRSPEQRAELTYRAPVTGTVLSIHRVRSHSWTARQWSGDDMTNVPVETRCSPPVNERLFGLDFVSDSTLDELMDLLGAPPANPGYSVVVTLNLEHVLRYRLSTRDRKVAQEAVADQIHPDDGAAVARTCEGLDALVARAGTPHVIIAIGFAAHHRLAGRLAAASTPRREGSWVVCVGADPEFHLGLKQRVPAWMRGAGLEWMHRLAMEPHRLWRRYLGGAPAFVEVVAREAWIARIRPGRHGSSTARGTGEEVAP